MKSKTSTGYIFFVCLTLLSILLSGLARPAIAQTEILDQSQTVENYGFWFDVDIIRWQEFIPELEDVTSVELFVYKIGNPGDMIVEIRTTDETILAQKTIAEADAPASGWARVEFDAPVPVSPGTKYRIYVYASIDSTSTANRYVWRGDDDSSYCSTCANSVSGSWPDYDFAFRTYGMPYTTYLPLVIK